MNMDYFVEAEIGGETAVLRKIIAPKSQSLYDLPSNLFLKAWKPTADRL
jgi:hypothetical protein